MGEPAQLAVDKVIRDDAGLLVAVTVCVGIVPSDRGLPAPAALSLRRSLPGRSSLWAFIANAQSLPRLAGISTGGKDWVPAYRSSKMADAYRSSVSVGVLERLTHTIIRSFAACSSSVITQSR